MMENFDLTSSRSSSESIHELVTGSHHFTVAGYSLVKGLGPGKCISSDIFNVGGYDWIVNFYPDGLNPKYSAAYVSVFVSLVSKGTDVRVYFEGTLMDQSGNGNHILIGSPDSADMFGNNVGYGRFYGRDELESSDYLKHDTLEIKCTVKVITHRVEIPRPDYIEIPPSNMGNEFKYLLDSGFGADITFSIANQKFKAHKLVLSARSSVFKSQFVENPNLTELEIVDIDPAVFKLMLEYIYTSDLPNTREFATVTFTMLQLLMAAVQYDLDRLKLFCEAILGEVITIDGVASTLAIAELYQCLQLKAFCLKFVFANLGAVKETCCFRFLEETFPSLVSEILKEAS